MRKRFSKTWATGATSLSTRAMLIAPVMALAIASPAYANPRGGVVAGGQAVITQIGNTLGINQTSSRAIIDWQSFNIGSSEKTIFNQPSSSSVALNRVNSNNPSQILGELSANGQVILVNPNGVFFGKGSQVDVAGLVASTANIADKDFMSGNMNFSQPGSPTASVVNQGTITAKQAGLVGFVAPSVENDGVITAKLGTVALASGDTFTLDMAGDHLIEVAVSANVQQQLAKNTGAIQADGGTVTMTAAAARDVVNSLVENSGAIQANSIQNVNGRIILSALGSNAVANNVAANKGQATGASEALNSGTLSASGKASGQTGGDITVTGDNVAILSGSVIDASGDAGGGAVQIGGDFHGQGAIPTALHTIAQSGATIDASAITTGNGGNVTVWADDWTNFAGSILARGGALSGNGGYVETSGKQILSMNGNVDASAPHGNPGAWLMDPADVTISTGSDTYESGNPNFTPTGAGEAVINVSDITTDLNAGTSVTITTGGDSYAGTNNGEITVSTAIVLSASSNNNPTLTLSAYSNIMVDEAITAPTTGAGKLNLILDADNGANASGVGGNGSGYIFLSYGANITTNGGNIIMGGGNGAITAGSGYAVGSSSSGRQAGIYVADMLNAGGGNIVMNGQGGSYSGGDNSGIYSYLYNPAISLATSGSGTITLTGHGGASDTTGSDYGVYLANGAISAGAGAITVNGTGGGAGGGNNDGVYMPYFTIDPAGTAAITLNGVGGYNSVGIDLGMVITSAGGNVAIDSSNSIYINNTTINYAAGTSYNLTLDAADAGGAGQINMATIYSFTPIAFSTNGGNITMGGGNGTITAGSGYAVGTGANGYQTGFNIYAASGGAVTIDAGGGNIVINGQGGTYSGGINDGVSLTYNYLIKTAGAGTITINGIGGATGGNDSGIYAYGNGGFNGAIETSGNGAISIIGQGGASTGSGNYGLSLWNNATITSSGGAPVSVEGIGGSGSAGISSCCSGASSFTLGGAGYSGDITFQADTFRGYPVKFP